jgi:hypothetical protein
MKDFLRFPYHLGQTVNIQGHRFVVCDIWSETLADGREAYRWRGFCTPDRCNDGIRNTSYNNHKSVYGGLLLTPTQPVRR